LAERIDEATRLWGVPSNEGLPSTLEKVRGNAQLHEHFGSILGAEGIELAAKPQPGSIPRGAGSIDTATVTLSAVGARSLLDRIDPDHEVSRDIGIDSALRAVLHRHGIGAAVSLDAASGQVGLATLTKHMVERLVELLSPKERPTSL
jgi:hypothetical protein